MVPPRAVAVVGYKAAGKTRVVEGLVQELKRRGKRVGTLKHTAEDAPLDAPGTDTHRHVEAGAIATAILSEKRSAVFLERAMELTEAAASLGPVDFIILEGFKSLDVCPRVLVPRETEEIKGLSNGLEIAIIDVAEGQSSGMEIAVMDAAGKVGARGPVPVLGISEASRLAGIVEARAFPLLSGMDCGGCGHASCQELGRAVLAGDASAEACVGYSKDLTLMVNGAQVPLKPFVEDALRGVVLGFVRSLKGVGEPRTVELELREGD